MTPSRPSLEQAFAEHRRVLDAAEPVLLPALERATEAVVACLRAGGKLLVCGNGGSAADAQHLAAELVGRFERERRGLAAIALTTDTSALTAIANDYSYDQVFSRQVEALGRAGDVLIGISTSGNSGNVVRAVEAAKKLGMKVVGLTGQGGGKLAALVDHLIAVPSTRVARVQEMHEIALHALSAAVDEGVG